MVLEHFGFGEGPFVVFLDDMAGVPAEVDGLHSLREPAVGLAVPIKGVSNFCAKRGLNSPPIQV